MNKQLNLAFLICMFFAVPPFTSLAQTHKITISTSIHFPTEKIEGFKNSMINISPKAIYNLNDKISLGFFYSRLMGKKSNQLLYSSDEKSLNKMYDFKNKGNLGGLVGQYNFVKQKKIKVFFELEAAYGQLNREISNGWVYREWIQLDNPSNYKEVDIVTFERLLTDLNIPIDPNTLKPYAAGKSTSELRSNIFNSNINLGGRYNFYNGLGTELRLNNIINYSSVNVDDNDYSSSKVNILNNLFGNVSVGLSYTF